MNSPESDELPKLADLTSANLDDTGVAALLRDIELLADIIEIIPKLAPRAHAPESPVLTLDDARAVLAARSVRGLQLRYRYDGATWWDTLMNTGTEWRLVRIRHDFDGI